jgi:excisionase family DNA binding protein
MSNLVKVEEVAEVLNVTRQRAYELIRRNMIPGVVRLGRQVRVDLEELEEWIKRGGKASLDES